MDQDHIDLAKTEFLWQTLSQAHNQAEDLCLNGLRQFRQSVDENVSD